MNIETMDIRTVDPDHTRKNSFFSDLDRHGLPYHAITVFILRGILNGNVLLSFRKQGQLW